MVAASPDLAGAIERDGYAVVPGVLGPDELATLVAAVERAGLDDDGAARRGRGGSVYALRDLLKLVPEVRRVAGSAAVRSLVEPVLGPGAFAARGLLFDKTAGANWAVPWHRDMTIAVRRRVDVPGFGPWTVKAGVPHVRPPLPILRRMLTVRLHLDDCPAANGPLRVLPGSHTHDLDLALDPGLGREDGAAAVTCPMARGDALVMRPLILHASPSSGAPGHRRVVHLEFAADPLPGGLEWSESEGGGVGPCASATGDLL